jgi:hypothetical protein
MTSAGPVPHPWRRFLRVSVRGLIVFVVVFGAGLGWIVRSAHIQRDAVAAIKKAGGHVVYSWEWDHGNAILGGRPWAPSWLVESIGVDFFGHVTVVYCIGSSSPTDTILAEVGRLNQLQRLSVSNTSVITEAERGDLNRLANLSILSLEGTQFTDAGLAHLKGLTNLSTLWIGSHKVTDAGLVQLKGLTNLSDLSLHCTQVTDAGLVHLKGLTNLSVLGLSSTQVTDAGLVHLKGLPNLSVLWLNGTQVTDAGVDELKQSLPSLKISR